MKKLTLIKRIDQGGFGIVDLVESSTGKQYARKTFSKNQPLSDELLANVIKRFAKEVRIQGSVNHPNIVPIIEANLDVSPPYYLMPLADSSLSKDLTADKTLDGSFVSALSDIVAGLEEMHSMQIYHRDLKPQNVLRFKRNAGKPEEQKFYAVSDFGLISIKESQISALTKTGMARQSDYYTAPEITKDLRYASVQSDVNSLGCILHDMVGTEDRVPCGEIREGGAFGPILLGCTNKDPKKRFKSAKAVLDAVLSIDPESHPATQKSTDFISALEGTDALDPAAWESLADFLDYEAQADDKRAICLKLSSDKIGELCASAPDHAKRIAIVFAEWVKTSSFNFDYCDGLANRLELFIESLPDFEAKVECLLSMLEMGTSHNRWYVERRFVNLCGDEMDVHLAKRLGIQIRIDEEDVCRAVSHLERSLSSFTRTELHPALVKVLADVCK
ncbi:protein kinase [Bradyrhizobium sp. Mp27]|uniref:serine/threonine protein kinase n=1 Tax=Bradyrhizobium sp. Mp27 TaxID=3042157 RepID=UPI00248BC627|nr:protein kinase [Bradyrhizobium sp. Mp27]MDI2072042.1 protein kinase [Bradyrhizobium sp. Mp27]